jgi:hypothetical protein
MNQSIYDAYVEAIVEISNKEPIIYACEPQNSEPKPVEPWMVRRILTARRLIESKVKEE